MRRSSVAVVQPPCSAWPAKARLFTASQAASSRPISKVRTRTSAGHFGRRSIGERDAHLVEVARRDACRPPRAARRRRDRRAENPQHQAAAAVRGDVLRRPRPRARRGRIRRRHRARPRGQRPVVRARRSRCAPRARKPRHRRGSPPNPGADVRDRATRRRSSAGCPSTRRGRVVDRATSRFDLGETGRSHLGNGRLGHPTRVP